MRVMAPGRSLRSSYGNLLPLSEQVADSFGLKVQSTLGFMSTLPSRRPGHAALRCGRVSLPEQIYLVTFTTQLRSPLLVDEATARIASGAFTDPHAWKHSRLLAWVLMPDHWHGLIELGGGESLSGLICRLKANTARCVRLETGGGAGAVWARGFHDRALRQEDDVLSAARYVVVNPIRAGLVKRLGDYPYWNAIWL